MEQILKGILKTLTFTHQEIVLKPTLGKETVISISDLIDVKYSEGTFTQNGYMAFCTVDGKGVDVVSPQTASINSHGIMFQKPQNSVANDIYTNLKSKISSNVNAVNQDSNPVINNVTINNSVSDTNYEKKKSFGAFCCPKCRGTNIQLWGTSANMTEFQRTGLNLNPLHPLTPFKTKTIRKEKKSGAKLALGLVTGGASLLVTGTKNKKHNEYFCQDCGKRWIGK